MFHIDLDPLKAPDILLNSFLKCKIHQMVYTNIMLHVFDCLMYSCPYTGMSQCTYNYNEYVL
jgi:hypothetical protein